MKTAAQDSVDKSARSSQQVAASDWENMWQRKFQHDLARKICHAVEQRSDDCDMEMHARVLAVLKQYNLSGGNKGRPCNTEKSEDCASPAQNLSTAAPPQSQDRQAAEWTVASVQTLITCDRHEASTIADAHNAALAAAYQKGKTDARKATLGYD